MWFAVFTSSTTSENKRLSDYHHYDRAQQCRAALQLAVLCHLLLTLANAVDRSSSYTVNKARKGQKKKIIKKKVILMKNSAVFLLVVTVCF